MTHDMVLTLLFFFFLLAGYCAADDIAALLQRHRADPSTALRDVMVQRCCSEHHGRCWCGSASTCLFYRCINCDMPVDAAGNALFDDFWARGIDHHAGPCPMCGGPMRKP